MNVTALGTDALTAPVIASLISPVIDPIIDSTVDPTIEVTAAVQAAEAAAGPCAAASPEERAGWLESIADAVTTASEELAVLADAETGLGRIRLDAEVMRCADQLRFYGAVAREGSWLAATIDHATTATPDLRRVRVPLGAVAVFGASNFPFAFGSLGNDSASALAAGCPVVVKGHPAHPLTHARLIQVATAALSAAGVPDGVLGAVTGYAAGQLLVLADAITAVAFTGSQSGGMALRALAQSRTRVIPVFAEMGTVNPVVVTPAGAAADPAALATGCVQSFTLGMGQFCTKPGLLLVPAGSGLGAAVAEALVAASPRGPMLTGGIAAAYVDGIYRLEAAGGVPTAVVTEPGTGNAVSAVVLQAQASHLVPGSALLAECFGPVIVVVEYADTEQLSTVLARLQGCLVGSVMTGGSDDPETATLVEAIARIAGRVAVDSWPTGVATTWAQHHGGPWPSTTVPAATSVGAAGLDRFTRPVAYQGAPQSALPPALVDANPWRITRRVDGKLAPPSATRPASRRARSAP